MAPADPSSNVQPAAIYYKSQATWLGMPLVHIAIGPPPKPGPPMNRVQGVIAIGNIATGVVAIGSLACGVIAIGGGAIGVFALGGVAMAALAAYGGLAVGGFAVGGLAVGIVAIGGGAIGYYACGGSALGVHIVSEAVRDPAAVQFFTAWAPWALKLKLVGFR